MRFEDAFRDWDLNSGHPFIKTDVISGKDKLSSLGQAFRLIIAERGLELTPQEVISGIGHPTTGRCKKCGEKSDDLMFGVCGECLWTDEEKEID